MKDTKPNCTTCMFFRPDEKFSLVGQCRRYAPRPRIYDISDEAEEGKGRHYADWPWVGGDDLCGEWRAE